MEKDFKVLCNQIRIEKGKKEMQKYLLECCVDSVESAIAAQKGGADRLELCGNLIIGGTTPSVELYRAVRKNTDIPIHVLLRPRFGDFLYTAYELEILYEEVKLFSSEGADGLVIGCLKPDGELDIEAMKRMIELGKGRKITLHRAFDVCKNPLKALEQAIELGVDTILTSGQEDSCMKGMDLLNTLQKKIEEEKNSICIMAGGGVNAQVIQSFLEKTSLSTFHMSGKITIPSKMIYRNERVNMGLQGISEYEIWRTEEENIKKAKDVLKGKMMN